MKVCGRVLMALLFAGMVLLILPVARADVISMQLIIPDPVNYPDYYSPTHFVWGGNGQGAWDVNPYLIKVDDNLQGWALACDDINGEIPEDPWYATVNDLHLAKNNVADPGPQKFTVTDTATTRLYYDAAGLAAWDIINNHFDKPGYDGWGAEQFGVATFAIWYLFAPADVAAQLNASQLQQVQTAAAAYLDWATYSNIDVTIYTPCGMNANCEGDPDLSVSQEFLYIAGDANPTAHQHNVAEGSALPTLAFDLLAVFAGIFLLRRRVLQRG